MNLVIRAMVDPGNLVNAVHISIKSRCLFVRDDDTGHFQCRISTALPEAPVASAVATAMFAKDAFVVRRLRGLDSPMQLDSDDLRAWREALVDAPREVFEKRMRERDTLERTNSSMLVQLKTRTDLVGVLSLGERTNGAYSPKDHQLLKNLGGQLALIIENAKLLERMVEHQRFQAELELAAEVQRSLLPVGNPDLKDFDLCGFCKPAQQVGGDYYDFISLSDECTGIAIADVSGKGISAALLMSVVQASLRGQLLSSMGRHELSDMISVVNRLISGSVSTSRYVTFFYTQLNRKDGTVRFVNAGHNPPMFYKASNQTISSLTTGGSVLGQFQAKFSRKVTRRSTPTTSSSVIPTASPKPRTNTKKSSARIAFATPLPKRLAARPKKLWTPSLNASPNGPMAHASMMTSPWSF